MSNSRTTRPKTERKLSLGFVAKKIELQEHCGQWYGHCPACNHGQLRSFVFNADLGSFFCHYAKIGGGVSSFSAHLGLTHASQGKK